MYWSELMNLEIFVKSFPPTITNLSNKITNTYKYDKNNDTISIIN